MAIGGFLDKNAPPSPDEIETALGPRYPLWLKMLQFIETNYQMPAALNFGGKKYGWNLWYRKSGKTLISLFPQPHAFIAQIVLGKAEVEKALTLKLGEGVGTLLRDTPQLHDGKWLFIPVRTAADEADVEQLLLVKKRPVKSRG